MNKNITDSFIDNLYNLSQVNLKTSVEFQAKKCLLDYLGVTFAGANYLKEKGEKLLRFTSSTQEDVAVIGFNRRANLYDAVFLNGLSSHAMDLDDGIRIGALHPGAPILSALISVVEKENINPKKFLTGIVVGYEAATRLARTLQPSHYEKGYHTTATCGTIGAAIGISIAMGFTKEQMKNAFASATISASGSLKVLEEGSELKPYNVGRASLLGLISAYMARAEFLGPENPLAGDTGFLNMMADQYDIKYLNSVENDFLYIDKVYFKLYAACRHCHPSIEAAFNIRRKRVFKPSEIKDIRIKTYRYVLGKHDHTEIYGISSAKMSIPYCVVVALLLGRVGVEEFNLELINNPSIIELVNKVSICDDEEINSLVPQMRPAIVKITTYKGECYEERVNFPKGEPENPLTDQELFDKFKFLAKFSSKTESESNKIINCVMNLENKLEELLTLL
ncbi:MmgE/PrpD family protein [uncultured Clostridium sp.]|uniref:MmgE/PrpD family protein n=1 Tax=uncultured Clostridium sp. TaxID=59620 RepID=UPI0028E8A363|nr:MmgE/PrpD family protein [uncultured Clostridium sp.]